MENKKKVINEILSFAITIGVVLFIKFFIVSPIRVNGESMYNTLHHKDIMLLNEFTYYFNDIERYDVVVIKHDGEYLIKRIIGLPGEFVEAKDGDVYINGKKIDDKYEYSETEDFDVVKVLDNQYFVLGDNRADSLDSRDFGCFDRSSIRGKTNFILFPLDRFGIKK